MASSLAIQLDDGRIVIGTPKPEDQGRLGDLEQGDEIELSGSDLDTSGHAMAEDVRVDVEGHAMTLRLPSAGDAEALRKALAIGAVTATLVAAGAIAAMQGNPATVAPPQSITMPARGPAPAADFQIRKETATDKMLEVPAPIPQPADTTTERLDHIAPAAGAGTGAGTAPTVPQTITAPARGPAPAADFQTRKQQQADEMLEAPQPLVEPSDISTD